MWCTRWFLPLLLLPLPTAPPYFLVLFLLTLALHARPCFYCIILLAALFLSSCYWQSFPLDAHLAGSWPNDITTFSEALNATLPSHLSTIDFTSPIMRVADRCWCDFASGLFEPYDVQKWERDSIQRAVAQIEKQWKQSLEPESTNITVPAVPFAVEPQEMTTALNFSTIGNETLFSKFRSFLSRCWDKPEPTTTPTIPADAIIPPEISIGQAAIPPATPTEPPLAPGQLDMRPFGFELVLDLRWSKFS